MQLKQRIKRLAAFLLALSMALGCMLLPLCPEKSILRWY